MFQYFPAFSEIFEKKVAFGMSKRNAHPFLPHLNHLDAFDDFAINQINAISTYL